VINFSSKTDKSNFIIHINNKFNNSIATFFTGDKSFASYPEPNIMEIIKKYQEYPITLSSPITFQRRRNINNDYHMYFSYTNIICSDTYYTKNIQSIEELFGHLSKLNVDVSDLENVYGMDMEPSKIMNYGNLIYKEYKEYKEY